MAEVWGKLNLKDHSEIVVVNAPPSFEPALKALEGVTVKRRPADAVVWLAYPKGTSKKYKSDISREAGNEGLGDAGFEPVRMIAIDEDWTGKRFRRVEFIENLTRDPRALVSKEARKRVARG